MPFVCNLNGRKDFYAATNEPWDGQDTVERVVPRRGLSIDFTEEFRAHPRTRALGIAPSSSDYLSDTLEISYRSNTFARLPAKETIMRSRFDWITQGQTLGPNPKCDID